MASLGRYDKLLVALAGAALTVGVGHEVHRAAGQSTAVPLAIVGQAGGSVTALVAGSARTVVGAGRQVLVFDIGDLDQPRPIGTSPVLPGSVHDIVLVDHYAYAALGQAGLAVVDIGSPAAATVSPTVTFILPLGSGVSSVSVQADGRRALAVGDGRIWVLDLRDPTSPAPQGQTLLRSSPVTVAAVGDLAYVLRSGGLTTVDVTDPWAPTVVNETALSGGNTVDMVAAPGGQDLYLADGALGLRVVSLREPRRPRIMTSLTGQATALALDGAGRLYLAGNLAREGRADLEKGLWSVDISDPATPKKIDVVPLEVAPSELAVGAGSVWLAASDMDLTALDSSTTPQTPIRRGSWASRPVTRVVLDSGRAYALTGVSRSPTGNPLGQWLEIYDVTQPEAPQRLGQVLVPTVDGAMIVVGHFAYVAAGFHQLAVIDVADPAAPQLVRTLELDAAAVGMAAAKGQLWLATGSELVAYSLAQPDAPKRGAMVTTPGEAQSVIVVGTTAYVADGSGGLLVVAIDDPTRPHILGRLNPSAGYPGPEAPVHGVQVAGTTAYLWRNDGAISVADVTNPAAPQERGFLNVTPGAYAAALYDGLLVVANRRPGYLSEWLRFEPVPVLDVGNPDTPRLLTGPRVNASVADVAADDAVVALAAGPAGLVLLRRTADLPPTPTLVPPPALTPQPRPTRIPTTPDPAWRKRLLLPLVLVPAAKLPPGPQLRQVDEEGGSVMQTTVEGRRLYAWVGNRLEVYSLDDPARPRELGKAFLLAGYPLQMMAQGDVVYCLIGQADQVQGYPELHLLVVDARDGAQPRMRSDTLVSAAWQGEGDRAPAMAVGPGRVYVQTVVRTEAQEFRPALVVVDTIDLNRPRVAGWLAIVDGYFGALATSGERLLVLGTQPALPGTEPTDTVMLGVWDLHDLTAPRQLGGVSFNFGWSVTMRVDGAWAYVGSDPGLQIVDISDPAQPRLAGSFAGTEDEPVRVFALAIEKGRAYLGDANFGRLLVVDVSDPNRPTPQGQLEVTDPPWFGPGAGSGWIAAAQKHVYIPGGGAGTIRIVDATMPSMLRETEPVTSAGWMSCLALDGNRLVVGQQAGYQLSLWRLTDPAHPSRAGLAPLPADRGSGVFGCDVAISDGRAYISRTSGYFNVVDVSDPADPRSLRDFYEPGGQDYANATLALAIDDGQGWIAQGGAGLLGLDLRGSTPTRPATRLGSPDRSQSVALLGHLALVADGHAGLSVVDVSDPMQPLPRGHVAVAGSATLVATAGLVAWLVVTRERPPLTDVDPATLLAIDVSDPTRPAVLGQLDLATTPLALAIDDTRVWLATNAGLLLVDASLSRSPRLVARSADRAPLTDVAARGDFAYALTNQQTLATYQLGP